MRRLISIVLFIGYISNSFAEGTKQLRPAVSDFGNVEINDQYRPFALESNSDSLHRLFIHIKSTSEKIYFGFQPKDRTLGTGTFRIKDASGAIVYNQTSVPVVSGAGFIENYDEAVAGPKISGLPAGGYNPLSFSPTSTGDFYIEFTTTLGAGVTYHFDLFDITVVDASNQPINGRLWSYAWDFSTQGGNNVFNSTMYVYTADKYTTSIFFNGMQPFGFVVSCNSKGTRNTGNEAIDRKSLKDTNATHPEFKVFLNIPDPTVYFAATVPTMIEDLSVLGSPITGSPVKFYLNMNKAGTIEVFLDLDGVAGYQTGNKDVVLVDIINAGGDTLIWDGKDAQGIFVISNVTVGVSSKFATGVTHFPIYDDEYNPNGIIVNRISPNASRAAVYWDDSNIPSGTINLTGASGNTNGHNFPVVADGYGNLHTINTWWNGYENNDLKSFTFAMDGTYLPICMKNVTIKNEESSVFINWQTVSETNNNFFEIERSTDATHWNSIAKIDGAGNSTKTIQYNFNDLNPINGISYYRIKQIDFDGKSTYSQVLSINTIEIFKTEFSSYPNPAINSITIDLGDQNSNILEILSIDGKNITTHVIITKLNSTSYSIDISSLDKGAYILSVNGDSNIFMKQ